MEGSNNADGYKKRGWCYLGQIVSETEALNVADELLQLIYSLVGTLQGEWNDELGYEISGYAPPPCKKLVAPLQERLEDMLGEELLPTYWFTTLYQNGSFLIAHRDRGACEVSVSMNLCGTQPWPLRMIDLEGKKQAVVMPPGTGVLYAGTEVLHWRSPLRASPEDVFLQCFLHFVRKNGPNAHQAYDGGYCKRLLGRV